MQLYFDSFLLMPTAPSMIDARNAILAADQARFGGANQNEIWAAFRAARHGPLRVLDHRQRPHGRRGVRQIRCPTSRPRARPTPT
jgi:hypothetical protein